MLPPPPAIARAIPAPPLVWRAAEALPHDDDASAADFFRQQCDATGAALPIGADFLAYLDTYPAAHLQWVSFARADTPRFGNASALIKLRIDMRALVVATDHAGGFLLFFPDDEDDDTQQFGGAAMTSTDDDQPRPPLDLSAAPITPTPTPAPDDDEDKRKGRGGSGDNPAFATLSHNIRPDVVATPTGLAVMTATKSADYHAEPKEPEPETASARLAAMLEGRAGRVVSEGDTRELAPIEPQRLDLGDASTVTRTTDAEQREAFDQQHTPADQIDDRQRALIAEIGAMRLELHSREGNTEDQRLDYKHESKAHDATQLDIAERASHEGDPLARSTLRLESLATSYHYAAFLAGALSDRAERDGDLAAADAYGKAASGFRMRHHEAHDAWHVSYTQEYAARGDERAQAWLEEHGHAERESAAHESPAAQQADEESAKRQDAERKERSGEASADVSLSASDRLAAQLEGSASRDERDAEEAAPQLAPLEPTDGGRGGAGRGMF